MSVPDPGSERGEKRVLDGEATSLAQKKAASLQQAFENWIFKDPKRAADLVETYNALFNSTRPREYYGSHMIFPGIASDITLRPHQKNAIAHALYGGNALRKEAMARLKAGEKQGRQTFYFDRNRRNELRNAAKQAGQKPQEKQHSKDAPAVE